MTATRVSVIVPAYNHARYIERCLQSIDDQDWPELEIIVIDDGSKDDSHARAQAFQSKHGRGIRVLRQQNAGAHAAINRGMALATGHYLTVCNSDDFFLPGRIRALAAAGGDFAFSGVVCIDDDERPVNSAFAKDLLAKQAAIPEFASVGFALLLTNVGISTGNFFFTRALQQKVGDFRPYRYCHDWDWALRALLLTEPRYVPGTFYGYRLHMNNSFLALQEAAAIECPELMRRFLKAAHSGQTENPLCPSPRNWPVYCEYFLETHKYQPFLMEWDSVDSPRYDWTPGAQDAP